ncbi:MAG: universal stress protein [Ardenticatenaceae bacterium]|nr:universal stress protein [Ardenticatenaceae bacterium]MCB9445223.1 universal stress protein [Ardenticatenaceae bacterium]
MPDNEQTIDSILVALDGSRPSQVAATLAVQIAKQEKLLVRGLYVVDELLVVEMETSPEKELSYKPSEVLLPDERANLLQNQGNIALRWLEALCQENEVPLRADLMFGGMPDVILNQAENMRLLALGRQGLGHDDGKGNDSMRLGSHFRTIAHKTSVPLLIGGGTLSPIRRILLAYDGSLPAQHALVWANLLQHIWQSHLLVVSVANETVSQLWLAEMEEQIGASGLQNYRFIGSQGDAADQILATISEENVDMIVMGGHQHSALLEWITGSTLDQVLRSTSQPIFVVGKQGD